MSLFSKIFNKDDPKDKLIPLYRQVVEHGRNPDWYINGGVKDSQDGRFDMIVAILCLILLRIETEADKTQDSVYLTELFVDDMDGQMRELGIGDVVVGKHVGNMVGALGGRLTAYREALTHDDMQQALVRNLYRGDPPKEDELIFVHKGLLEIYENIKNIDAQSLILGQAAW